MCAPFIISHEQESSQADAIASLRSPPEAYSPHASMAPQFAGDHEPCHGYHRERDMRQSWYSWYSMQGDSKTAGDSLEMKHGPVFVDADAMKEKVHHRDAHKLTQAYFPVNCQLIFLPSSTACQWVASSGQRSLLKPAIPYWFQLFW